MFVVILTADVEYVLRALLDCSQEQRLEVADKYQATNNQSIPEHIKATNNDGKWPLWAIFSVELLLLSPEQSCAMYTQKLLQCDPLKESLVIENICSQNDNDIQALIECYEKMSSHSLSDDLLAKCTPEVAESMCGLLSKKV
jgi:hypothetical protein